ncbi:sensor domain-containing phosphodiesterase [Erwinia sorbitola]|uniref:EAL domain-containing protein n=1 Tax=Erwinia sorbitola TaxID=2681984 RepID=A0A6I6ENN2_9GAMM|nr:EAL domain-containing protein [Erwinia sorbitola]MTD28571.1 EAL domain-containing protein [Erwinia sorbitola]QGU86679.1 EAL domain-containing protein [Erwinia sorbitola]
MKKSALLKGCARHWWGLPMLLSLLLLPLASSLSFRLWIPGGYVYLIYLPLAMMIAMLMVFDWAALPGIFAALCLHYFQRYTGVQAMMIISIFMTTLVLCWWGYRSQEKSRWCISFGNLYQVSERLFWLAFAMPTLFIILNQLVMLSDILPEENSIFVPDSSSMHALLNYQSTLLAALALVPLCYFSIRIFCNPRFLFILIFRCKRQFSPTVTLREWLIWMALLIASLMMLTQLISTPDNLVATEYGVPILLPLMLWAALRFGYIFTTLCWGMLLLVLYQFHKFFISSAIEPHGLAIISANLLAFTLTILLMSDICTRQRRLLAKAREMAMTDPVIGLPNLRALTRDLVASSESALCFLRIPDLDRLSRTYGLQLRIQYKRSLAVHLQPCLLAGEDIYQLPGFDLVLRLNTAAHQSRIEGIEVRLKDYHLSWDGLPIHPDVGISYCTITAPVVHLYELLGEMSAMAEMSLRSGHAENMQRPQSVPVQRQITGKLEILHDIQQALLRGGFRLMTQRIRGVRGNDYHEILLEMVTVQGERIKPSQFMPVVREFGLTWEVDRLMLDQALEFIHFHRETFPGIRLAVNFFAATLCRPQFVEEIASRLNENDIEAWQLIIAVEESAILSDHSWGYRTIAQLRHIGCRVAIDDFGNGYSSYARLKMIQADILKIDGSFIQNMQNNSLDYQIIQSICAMARLKRMQVVAEGVDTEEMAVELRKLGVDYLQGRIAGLPVSLNDLASTEAEARSGVRL